MTQRVAAADSGKAPRPRRAKGRVAPKAPAVFDVHALLESAGVDRTVVEYREGAMVFRQGDRADRVFYIQAGGVRLSVLSKTGREAVVATLGPRDFFGESCLAGQAIRLGSATATTGEPHRVDRQGPDAAPAPRRARDVRSLHRPHAGAEQPDRRRPDRSAGQFAPAERAGSRTVSVPTSSARRPARRPARRG